MGREGALCLGRGRDPEPATSAGSSPAGSRAEAPRSRRAIAWALRRRGEDAIAVAQIGDGTLGEGTLYEAFTFAALLEAPVLFLLEYNGWAQSTDVQATTTRGRLRSGPPGSASRCDWASDDDPAALSRALGPGRREGPRGASVPSGRRDPAPDGPQQGGRQPAAGTGRAAVADATRCRRLGEGGRAGSSPPRPPSRLSTRLIEDVGGRSPARSRGRPDPPGRPHRRLPTTGSARTAGAKRSTAGSPRS